jgi:aminoglycoside phosphotransferase (APT) family kinase protein
MVHRLHDDEIRIDHDLVRKLVDTQFPKYSMMPLSRLDATGSTNVLFRLGGALLVRLPRQPGGSVGIDKERRWLPELGHHLPVAVPDVVALGEPSSGFAERWSIVRWLDGELPRACPPNEQPTHERLALATDLADVILAIRTIEVPDEAANDPTLRGYRGRSLSEFDKQTRNNIRKCRSINDLDLDLDAALEVWSNALDIPGADKVDPDRWYHSDLVAENLLLTGDRLTAVLDFGGLAIGDPTIDLLGAWEVLDGPAREAFRTRLGVDDAEWLRGRAWALAIALVTFPYYWATMPSRRMDRLAMARNVLADATKERRRL